MSTEGSWRRCSQEHVPAGGNVEDALAGGNVEDALAGGKVEDALEHALAGGNVAAGVVRWR